MKFLIVEDDHSKIAKIRQVIEGSVAASSAQIIVRQTVFDAVSYLLEGQPIDIMILDLHLPVRKDSEIKILSGLNIINEINRRSGMTRPTHILGLTAEIPPPEQAEKFFKDEGWALIGYDPSKIDWEVTISNKIFYAGEKKGVEIKLSKKGILYLSATPTNGHVILLGKESRRISDTLRMSTYRDDYGFCSREGCTLETMTAGLMTESPDILHFSGHGDGQGIALEDNEGKIHYVSTEILQRLFAQFGKEIKCVILSSCYSAEQAATLSENNIYVIGMQDSIAVGIGEEFAVGFYQALGERKDILDCFTLGKIMVKAKFDESEDIPQLWHNGELLE